MQVEIAKVPESPSVAEETSVWPFLFGLALTAFLGGLPVSRPFALSGFALLLASAVGWTWSNVLRPPPEEGEIGGRSRLWWGMVLLIVSEAGLFLSGLLALTAHPEAFARDLNRPLTLGASLVLWSSGFVGGWAVKRMDRRGRFTGGLAATIALGLLFVGYQAFEYRRLYAEGFTLQSGGQGSIFYFLTGLHGAHVVGGLAMLGAILGLALARRIGPSRAPAVRAVMLYWHFVDAVWVVLYAVLYLRLF